MNDVKASTLSPELLQLMEAYWRAANYLSVGQIYLCDNPLLKHPFVPTDVKHLIRRFPRFWSRVSCATWPTSTRRRVRDPCVVHTPKIDVERLRFLALSFSLRRRGSYPLLGHWH